MRKASTNAASRPVHISGAVTAPWLVWAACTWNVVHKKAPGAIRAIAFIVSEVSVSVRFMVTPLSAAPFDSSTVVSLSVASLNMLRIFSQTIQND